VNRTNGKYLIAGKETLSIKDIFVQINDIFLDGNGAFSIEESTKGNDQVIEIILPNIRLHDYRTAFIDIKNKAFTL
jgi:hypothetical protein